MNGAAEAQAPLTVRPATATDQAPLCTVYNHYITRSHCTFELAPVDPAGHAAWFDQFAVTGPHRLLVASDAAGTLLGWACSTPMNPRPAYATSVATSVYLRLGCAGRGLGGALYEALFAALAGEDLHRAYALIAQPNAASMALHRRCGFRHAAHLSGAGRKFGQYWDVVWLEKALPGA